MYSRKSETKIRRETITFKSKRRVDDGRPGEKNRGKVRERGYDPEKSK